MTDKRMEAVIKAMELAMEEQRVMTVINLDMKPIAQAAISADPVTEDVKRLVELLREATIIAEPNDWPLPVRETRIVNWKIAARNELKKFDISTTQRLPQSASHAHDGELT